MGYLFVFAEFLCNRSPKCEQKISKIIFRQYRNKTLFLRGQNLFLGYQNLWVSLLFSEFSVDLKKKKGHRANLVYFCLSSLLISIKKKVISPNCSTYLLVFSWFFPQKSHHFETVARERGVWVSMLGILGG